SAAFWASNAYARIFTCSTFNATNVTLLGLGFDFPVQLNPGDTVTFTMVAGSAFFGGPLNNTIVTAGQSVAYTATTAGLVEFTGVGFGGNSANYSCVSASSGTPPQTPQTQQTINNAQT